MSEPQIALALFAGVVAILARKLPRANLWIGVGAMSFIVTTWWWRQGFSYPPAFSVAADAAFCLLIYFYGKLRWEMELYRLYLGSILVNIVYLWGLLGYLWGSPAAAHFAYVLVLEAINWAALLLIFGAAVLAWIGDNGISPGRLLGDRLSRAKRYALAERKRPHFWHSEA